MKAWLLIFVALVLSHPLAADAEDAPCPQKYATVKELDDCLQDAKCEMRDAFPEEHRRNNWVRQAATSFVMETLSANEGCVSLKSLIESFEESVRTCTRSEATIALKTVMFTLTKRKKTVSASRRHDRPSTTYTLVERGGCT